MDRSSAELLGFLAFIFVLFFVVSILFAFARGPMERWIERIFPGGNFSRKISKDIYIRVDPEVQDKSSDETGFTVNLQTAKPTDLAQPARAEIQPLEGPKREFYREAWREIQDLFPQSPAAAVREADRLLAELIPETGEQTIPLQKMEVSGGGEDIGKSLGMMREVIAGAQNAHRAQRGIARAKAHQEASIEDLRLAMDHYSVIFDKLLGFGERRWDTQ